MTLARRDIPLDAPVPAMRAAWNIGRDLCADCGGYHRVWGLLRAVGAVGGPAVDAALLGPIIGERLRPGGSVLLAGSADAGLLSLVLGAAPRPLSVTVADLCPTPLAVLDRMILPQDVSLATLRTDIAELDGETQWDLAFCHSMLPFVPAAVRPRVTRALKRALAPGGHAIVVARTSRPLDPREAPAHDAAWLEQTKDRIAESGVTLPGPQEEVEALLTTFAERRREHLAGFARPEEIASVLEEGGLQVLQHIAGQPSTRVTMGGDAHVRHSHIFVCS